jgi:hypothetical protein
MDSRHTRSALVAAALLTATARPATSEAYEWLGGEVKTFLGGSLPLNDSTSLNATV